jgi:hypothetical protein
MTVTEPRVTQRAGGPSESRRAVALWAGAVLAGTFLSAVLLYHFMWAHPGTSTMGTPHHANDQMQSMWFLKWIPWRLLHGHNPFHSTAIDYPGGVNLAWNTSTPTLALLAAPLTLTAGATLSYNLLMTLAPAATSTTAFLWLRRHVRSEVAAVAGGVLIGFGPFATGHLKGHLHLVFTALIPVLLILVEDLLWRRPRPQARTAAYLGIGTAAQLGISEELLAIVGIATVAALLAYLTVDARALGRALRESAPWLCAAALVMLVVASPLLVEQFVVSGSYPMQNMVWRATVNDYLWPGPSNQALHLFRVGGHNVGDAEDGAYAGVALLTVVCVGLLLTWRDRLVRCAAVTGAVLVLLSFGDIHALGIALPWHYLGRLGLFSSILPIRFCFALWFVAAWLIARWLAALLREARTAPSGSVRVMPVLGIGAVALALLTLVPRFLPATHLPNAPRFLTQAHRGLPAGSPIVLLPSSTPHDALPMYFMQQADFRYSEPGGYAYRRSGSGSTLWAGSTPLVDFIQHRGSHAANLDAARAELATVGYRAVVVVQGLPGTATSMRQAEELTGRPPDSITGGVAFWRLG